MKRMERIVNENSQNEIESILEITLLTYVKDKHFSVCVCDMLINPPLICSLQKLKMTFIAKSQWNHPSQ